MPAALPGESKDRALNDRRDIHHLIQRHVCAAHSPCLTAVFSGVFF